LVKSSVIIPFKKTQRVISLFYKTCIYPDTEIESYPNSYTLVQKEELKELLTYTWGW